MSSSGSPSPKRAPSRAADAVTVRAPIQSPASYGQWDTLRPKHPLDARPWTHPTPRRSRPTPGPRCPRPTPAHRPFSVYGIEVAALGYGMMSMYWCWRLSIESGCCSVSPKEETSRNPAIGGAYGLWQAEGSVARSLVTSPPGQDTEQQPDSNDSRHHQYMLIHSIDKDSDHTAGNGERKQ